VAYYAAFLPIINEEKNKEYRPKHLAYIDELCERGKVHSFGRFLDGVGGLVILTCQSLEEAESLMANDPCVIHGARTFEVHEWEMNVAK